MLESRPSIATAEAFESSKMPPAVPSDAARGRVTTGVEGPDPRPPRHLSDLGTPVD
jgi:hypothetical protein